MKRVHLVGIAFVVLLLLAGCVDVTVTSTVDSEAEIERLQFEMEMDRQTYQLLLGEAQNEGYDEVAEWIAADIERDMGEGTVASIEYEDREVNGRWVAWVALNEPDKDELENVTIEETEEDTIRYRDTGTADAADEEDINEMTYRVEMPGEIVDTNADQVNEETNTAIWNLSEPATTPDEIYVESEADDGFLSGADLGLGEVIIIGLVTTVIGVAIAKKTGYAVPGLD